MSHQDWNVIQFSGPVKKAKRGEQAVQDAYRRGNEVEAIRRNQGSNRNNAPVINPRMLDEDSDVVPVAQLPHEFRIAMQRARTAAQMSQADLARRINEKQSVVNDYESGRAVPNPNIITKLERALNCRLPRPRKN